MLVPSKDTICDQMRQLVGAPNYLLTFDKNELLVGRTPPDRSIQNVVPLSLRPTILHLTYYSILPTHPGERQMYDPLRLAS